MSSSMPKLPTRKEKIAAAEGSLKPSGPSPRAAGLHEAMFSQVSNLASNPAVMRLMQSPELLETVKERDPALKRLLEENPAMSELLAPEKLRSVLEMVKGPERMLSQGAMALGGMDLSEQRQAVMQLESYSRDLRSRFQQQQPQPPLPQLGADGATAAMLQMRARMQQLQQHLAAQAAGASAANAAAAGAGAAAAQRPWAAGMAPPHQSPAFFNPPSVPQPSPSAAPSSLQGVGLGGGGAGGGEQGGYSFSHSEREVTLGELPYDAQQKLLTAYGVPRDDAPGPRSGLESGSGPGVAGADGSGGSGVPQVALPSFSTWQQEQAAAAARAAQALPPSAWGGPMMQGMAHGLAMPPQLPAVAATPLPMSTPSRDDGAAGGGGAASGAPGGPWPGLSHGPSHGHFHGHGFHAHGGGSHPHFHQHQHHQGVGAQGHQHQPGGRCCDGHGHGDQHQHQMYGSEHGQYDGQFGLYGLGGGGGTRAKVRPRDYYEPVVPNLTWRRPEGQETCGTLYRRAYHRYCDMMFFPPYFALAALLVVAAPGLPFWLLAVGLLAASVPGTYCFVVVLAGLPRDKMPTSRNFLSLIATCELVYPIVYGWHVLPYWHGLASTTTLLLLAGFVLMPLLHLHAATADPGYVPRRQDLQEVKAAAAAAAQPTEAAAAAATTQDEKPPPTDGPGTGSSGAAAAAGVGAAVAAGALGLGMLGLTAPLPEEDAGEGGGSMAAVVTAAAADVAAERQCGTCLVPRPLRSKHCQFCNRCVRRFDHHCPAIANCVGEANERSFAAWLFIMWVTQILVVYVAVSFILQRYLTASGRAAASSAPDTGPAAVWAAVRWAAAGPERGLLLMAGLQALCFIPGTYLAARQAFCILANLTANELINRNRYNYLQDGHGNYCNRFDRGVALNCFSFWLERDSNWRAQFDAGEREMCRRGVRRLSYWTVGWWMTWQDDNAARRDELRQAVVDLRKEKARRGAAVRAEAAAAVQAAAAGAAAAAAAASAKKA